MFHPIRQDFPIDSNKRDDVSLIYHITQLTNYGRVAPNCSTNVDRRTTLIEFYSEKVALMFSCYDVGKNPFYHLVSQVWRSESRDTDYNTLIGAI
jgi:hypothetical protein